MCITLLLEEVIHKGLLGSFTNSVNCVGLACFLTEGGGLISSSKIGTFSLVQTSQHSGACGSTSSLPSASTSTFLWNSLLAAKLLS